MADSKRKRDKKAKTAQPRTERDEVSHPRLSGQTEFVVRIMDTLTSMLNRRQISQLQFGAGDKYRLAHEMTSASSGGSMDFDRARGSSGLSPTPALTFLMAAETVSEAKKRLYPKDFAIVHRVCVLGLTIEQAAKQLYDSQWDGEWAPYQRQAGWKFRNGLDALADMWWPEARSKMEKRTGQESRPIRAAMTERPVVTDVVVVPRSVAVAHAEDGKVSRGQSQRRCG